MRLIPRSCEILSFGIQSRPMGPSAVFGKADFPLVLETEPLTKSRRWESTTPAKSNLADVLQSTEWAQGIRSVKPFR
jgi:hypothetical protein